VSQEQELSTEVLADTVEMQTYYLSENLHLPYEEISESRASSSAGEEQVQFLQFCEQLATFVPHLINRRGDPQNRLKIGTLQLINGLCQATSQSTATSCLTILQQSSILSIILQSLSPGLS
jgi:hypothetical protein